MNARLFYISVATGSYGTEAGEVYHTYRYGLQITIIAKPSLSRRIVVFICIGTNILSFVRAYVYVQISGLHA